MIVEVEEIVAFEFAPRDATLTDEQLVDLEEFASQDFAEDSEVVISGFAGFSAGSEWAEFISNERALTLQSALADLGIDATIISFGRDAAGEVLGDAMDKAVPEGLTHNRWAFVSAVVLEEADESSTTDSMSDEESSEVLIEAPKPSPSEVRDSLPLQP